MEMNFSVLVAGKLFTTKISIPSSKLVFTFIVQINAVLTHNCTERTFLNKLCHRPPMGNYFWMKIEKFYVVFQFWMKRKCRRNLGKKRRHGSSYDQLCLACRNTNSCL